jgi:Putative addiction module component
MALFTRSGFIWSTERLWCEAAEFVEPVEDDSLGKRAWLRSTILSMSIKEIEAAVLKLVPKDRARLAGKLLDSLEDLSEEESESLWAQEAERRDAAWGLSDRSRSAKKVLSRVRTRLRTNQCEGKTSVSLSRHPS